MFLPGLEDGEAEVRAWLGQVLLGIPSALVRMLVRGDGAHPTDLSLPKSLPRPITKRRHVLRSWGLGFLRRNLGDHSSARGSRVWGTGLGGSASSLVAEQGRGLWSGCRGAESPQAWHCELCAWTPGFLT